MANESMPADPLPADFVPAGHVAVHRVTDGEDWGRVADQYNVEVPNLIFFNFQTSDPEEINWYLRNNVGCDTSLDGGINWAFSSSADPGLIYIPAAEVITFDEQEEEEIVGSQPVLQRCMEVALGIPDNRGKRIRRMLSKAEDHGPASLWFYGEAAVKYYIDINHSNEDRRTMTQDTNGAVPFDGDVRIFRQHPQSQWRQYPFSEIIVRDTNAHQSKRDLLIYLEGVEAEIFQSWEAMAAVEGHFETGGSALSPLIVEFLKHVHDLAEIPDHIYYLYQHEDEL